MSMDCEKNCLNAGNQCIDCVDMSHYCEQTTAGTFVIKKEPDLLKLLLPRDFMNDSCVNCRFRLSMYVGPMGCILFNKDESEMKSIKIKPGRYLQQRLPECIELTEKFKEYL